MSVGSLSALLDQVNFKIIGPRREAWLDDLICDYRKPKRRVGVPPSVASVRCFYVGGVSGAEAVAFTPPVLSQSGTLATSKF
jgi:hypothetical protein